MKHRTVAVTTIILLTLIACGHRLKPKLYQVHDNRGILLKNIDSYYLDGFRLSRNLDSAAIIKGNGNILVANYIGPDSGQIFIAAKVISVDQTVKYRLYVELPSAIKQDSIDIEDKSICHIIGRYDLEERLRQYECCLGYLLVDSVKKSSFYGILAATYVNPMNDTLKFKGDLKALRKK
ncbi:MAG: hypothetical protein JSV44_12320 [Candidatus Zixiibacteriota bacterium]|nr:MAG: hypothetical protein JSV44_12320 [candidate division Zixibacteria bacterium]